jgi:hypothetical protein
VNFLKRKEALSVLKEVLENCKSLDGHYFELSAPCASTQTVGGYQIVIHATLDEKTKNVIQAILTKYQLGYQEGSLWKTRQSKNKTAPDTFIIYKPKLKSN